MESSFRIILAQGCGQAILKMKGLTSRASILKVYCLIQLGVALFLILFTAIQWFASQFGVIRMALVVPLIVTSLEGAAVLLVFFTLWKPHRGYFGVWAMLGLFRIIISFYLPHIMWICLAPWPPPQLVPFVPVIPCVEFFFGVVTIIWLWFLRSTFEYSASRV